MKQGTKEWADARLGKITASRFGDVLTNARGGEGLSVTAESYLVEKLTEILTGDSRELSGAALEWGHEFEADARDLYEVQTLVEVTQVGFIQHPEYPLIGASPDGLIGEDGGIEIKCPYNSTVHVERLLGAEIDKKYYAQIQGNLWVTGRSWWDFVTYDPRMEDPGKRILVQRVEADSKFIATLESKLQEFLNIYRQRAAKLGIEL